VYENRVLRRIFVPKWEEVAGDWRRLHSDELHNLYVELLHNFNFYRTYIRNWSNSNFGTIITVKVKVKLFLCLTKHHAMKKYPVLS
jgi:hypothetical protein